MRRLSLLLAGLLTLGLVASACASDLDPALEIGSTELSRSDVAELVEEAQRLQDQYADRNGNQQPGVPFLGIPPGGPDGTVAANLVEGVLEVNISSAVLAAVYEARGIEISDAERAAQVEQFDVVLETFGFTESDLEGGLGALIRDYLVDYGLLVQNLGLFEPTEAELGDLARVAGRELDDGLRSQVLAAIEQSPSILALQLASSQADVTIDPRYSEWAPLAVDFIDSQQQLAHLVVLPRGLSVGLPPEFDTLLR